MDGSRIALSLSLSLSPLLSHLSHLSVCLLSVCLPEKVTFSYTGGKENVSHPEWPLVRRDLPSGHIGADRQTHRATEEGRGGTKTGRREGQLTRKSATSWSSGHRGDCDLAGRSSALDQLIRSSDLCQCMLTCDR